MFLARTLVVLLAFSQPYYVRTASDYISTTIEQYPYQVSVEDSRDGHWCSGAILTKRYVITSAFCVDCIPCDYMVRAGSSTINEDGEGTVIDVGSVYLHPNYERVIGYPDGSFGYDIALLWLRRSLEFSDTIRPVVLPECSVQKTPEGAVGVLTGWEWTKRPLKKVVRSVWSKSDCEKFYTDKTATTDRRFCTGPSKGETAQCDGHLEYGGPFVINGSLYGITSEFETCGDHYGPARLSSIPALRSFIEGKICTRTVREDPNSPFKCCPS